jgi:hypothetical protein
VSVPLRSSDRVGVGRSPPPPPEPHPARAPRVMIATAATAARMVRPSAQSQAVARAARQACQVLRRLSARPTGGADRHGLLRQTLCL